MAKIRMGQNRTSTIVKTHPTLLQPNIFFILAAKSPKYEIFRFYIFQLRVIFEFQNRAGKTQANPSKYLIRPTQTPTHVQPLQIFKNQEISFFHGIVKF